MPRKATRTKRVETKSKVQSNYSPLVNFLYGSIAIVLLLSVLLLFAKVFSKKDVGQISNQAANIEKNLPENTQITPTGMTRATGSANPTVVVTVSPTKGAVAVNVSPTKAAPTARPTIAATITPTKQPVTSPTSMPKATAVPTAKPTPAEVARKESVYTVKVGDTLWSIAESYYKSGYRWNDIAVKNKLANPNLIAAGTKLTLPSTEGQSQLGAATDTKGGQTATYTVKQGDTLWKIAVEMYQNGYRWTDIAKANNLANPGVIHSGNVFKIPRP